LTDSFILSLHDALPILSAVMSVVTKSGTNTYSGTGFFFGRNQNLNARNSFATTAKPPYKQERGGGSLGGPIALNQTHFFGAFEVDRKSTRLNSSHEWIS